jgi:dipeptidyl aminopeptidase/acylaminoacyl peptidase
MMAVKITNSLSTSSQNASILSSATMLKYNKSVLSLLLTISLICCGCTSVSAPSQNASLEKQAQAIALIRGYFEAPEDRNFDVEPELFSIDDVQFNVIKVSGTLHDGKYLMDTFAVDTVSEKKYFYSQEKKQYAEFLWAPFFASADSPDGKYRAESAGMSEETVSGLVSLKEMRIIDLENGETLWSDRGFFNNQFLWSPDGNYLAIRYSGRKWTETKIIKIKTWSEMSNPNTNDLLLVVDQEADLADAGLTVIEPLKWETDNALLLKAEWDTNTGEKVTGEFQYNIQTHVYSDAKLETELAG